MFAERNYSKIIELLKPSHYHSQKKKECSKNNNLVYSILKELRCYWVPFHPINKKIVGETNLNKRLNAVLKILQSLEVIEMKNGYVRLKPYSSAIAFNVASLNEIQFELMKENQILETQITDILHQYSYTHKLFPNIQISFEQSALELFLQDISPLNYNPQLVNWLFLWKHSLPLPLSNSSSSTFDPLQPPSLKCTVNN
ncbi:hypothetical protein EHI8A_039410 [Entamoeba histolytica HM-1:IMSS-B]|uniref:Uncharacterized protein n=6 Tax=Entamoeba histolytica TaxID=5759 RepID=C4M5C1_ENTH1|nr:hypothetical protein EHI_121750 [Entamoeba histolytica HM-1:IMSS]EMD48387.1 Hypothetical protein EHI5A_021410 [Entamoeba histolytica KU27]EMH73484.1 hypothetical protein EHI8A_039410 [Entamoeba histolytica HM-1:IMSS-B]EMS12371.1 hypothetical protein KM1_029620 [Entamoeba histolytica HM-3:IMSS]ENY61932.1 hypothetical protein EHI7A_039490 [Entamoeba histolytica HM-1:IMSS-A]GAT96620.1 hypothetical protein CL6EHI_121750 [Entamoeba histolytica]|eukprot:XP_651780.1 hypothetical protein EHI_121750 [Entamoeba histolytica HM-1:IMSS]